MRATFVAATMFLVVACGSPGPTGTPSANTPVPATLPTATIQPVPATRQTPTTQPTSAPTLQPTALHTPSAQPSPTTTPTPTREPTVGPSTVPPPLQSPTFEVPPPIDGPTGSPAPPLQSACLAMVDQAVGDFARRLVLDLAFDEGVNQRDIARLEVGFEGANDADPVDATHQFATTWQAVLGYRPSDPDPLRINVATVETPDGVVHDMLPALSDAIGTIPRNFGPGDSVGELCGGFGDPF